MSDGAYFKTELIEALIDAGTKVVCVSENVLENVCEHCIVEPFKDEITAYQNALLVTMMDIIYEEIKRLTPAQQEIIHHYFFLGKRIKHISHELHLRIPTLVERKDGALKKLRLRLSRNPVFIRIYQEYIDEDLPPGWLEKSEKLPDK